MVEFELVHRECGGIVVEDPFSPPYDYEHDDGHVSIHPALRCSKCGVEILGDAQLEGTIP